MWMFDLKHGVEMRARFAGSALFDQESGQDEMGIGITSVRRNRAPQIRSVSYTHLRAHETVLDIVCRLLLEKKKNSTHDLVTH